MPLFNYECGSCGKKFEELVSSSSEKVSCPSCRSEDVKKQLPNRICSSGGGGSHSHGGRDCAG